MNKAGEVFENAILHWRDVGGKGTALIPAPLNDKIMVLGVLQRVYARSPTCKTLIVTNDFQERQNVIDFLTTQEGEDENNKEFKELIKSGTLKVFTSSFLDKSYFPFNFHLMIAYRLDSLSDKTIHYMTNSKFKLAVINKLLANYEDMNKLYKVAPILSDFKANEVEEIRLSLPVEEMQVGVDIPEDSEFANIINKYNEYISTSISIFGSFDIMQQARTGNTVLNISSMQICNRIAQENGWHEHLDMTVEFNVQIDNLYNPVNLKERASKTYEIIRLRSQALSDYDNKLDEIFNIVKDNFNKKILIINKRGEFANKVTDYINNMSESTICGNYHDRVDKIPMIDVYGNLVRYKSGAKKGEPRYMGADAQKTRNAELFRQGKYRVLSTNNAPDKDLTASVDIIIITSPQCESIKSYMYRLSNVDYSSGSIKLYSLFCKGTMEQKLLEQKELTINHTIINNCEKSVINKNNSDFIVVD